MSNSAPFIPLSENISFYSFDKNNSDKVLYFLRNKNLPFNTVQISLTIPQELRNYTTSPSKCIQYNLEDNAVISAPSDYLEPIFHQYCDKEKFSHIPSESYGKWVSFNADESCFILNIGYVFELSKDYSKTPTCMYLTVSNSPIPSSYYHYANPSKGSICSHPELISKSGNKINYCSMVFDHPCNCSYYQKDSTLISTYSITSKLTNFTKQISSVYTRYSSSIQISILDNTNENEVILQASFSSFEGFTISDLYQESETLIDEVLSIYKDSDYEINKTFSLETSNLKVRKSYIASLV